jgi:hypothetical protein
MALTYLQRSYAGGASAGTLLASIGSGTTSFSSSSSLSGWTDITGLGFAGNIVVAVEYGTANEEKILCTFNGTTFTIVSRNYDGTNFSGTHAAGSTFVLVYTAEEAAEANDVVQTMKTILTNTGTATTPANITVNGTASVGTGQTPAAIDHSHVIPSTSLSTWLGTIGALPSGVTVPYASLTGAPVAPAAATATSSTNPTITASTGTTTLLSTTASPTGSFTNYTWHASCKQQSTPTATSDVNFVILQRLVGGSTWTAVATNNVGTVATALQYQNIAASGAWSSSGSTDSEFQLAMYNVAASTWTASSVRLTVIGLS